jgi:subtilisin
MNAKPDEARGSEQALRTSTRGGSAGKRVGSRCRQYMIAPATGDIAERIMIEQLKNHGAEIVRTIPATQTGCPLVVVALLNDDRAALLRPSTRGRLIVEQDQTLLAASRATSLLRPAVVSTPLGRGFATTIQVFGENDEPVEQAEVQLFGEQWTTQGLTGSDGKVTLNLYGEMPDRVQAVVVKPHSEYWGLWKRRPRLETDTANIVVLRSLPKIERFGWGAQTMRLDRLPAKCGGRGVKLALVDSGVATNHPQLAPIKHVFEANGDDEQSWSQDPTGHGTACAGIITASNIDRCVGGYAPDADIYVYKLPVDAHASDLAAALDCCVQSEVDLVCIGFGCRRGSAIIEQRLVTAKQRGIAVVAAAGSIGENVLFPACSPHALAVAAVGQSGAYPEETPHAAYGPVTRRRGGLFVPAFSCRGPEVDVCAPGVAVVSSQSPEGYVAADGTSLAAAHVAALAALVLAHGADFQREFATRNTRRVERLFQILKATAHTVGDPMECGAGVPDALRALGLRPQAEALIPLAARLSEMRSALWFAGLQGADGGAAVPEPPRGPAATTGAPLNVAPPSDTAARGASVGELKTAMQMAGLSR